LEVFILNTREREIDKQTTARERDRRRNEDEDDSSRRFVSAKDFACAIAVREGGILSRIAWNICCSVPPHRAQERSGSRVRVRVSEASSNSYRSLSSRRTRSEKCRWRFHFIGGAAAATATTSNEMPSSPELASADGIVSLVSSSWLNTFIAVVVLIHLLVLVRSSFASTNRSHARTHQQRAGPVHSVAGTRDDCHADQEGAVKPPSTSPPSPSPSPPSCHRIPLVN